MAIVVTEQEWKDWKEHRVTEAFKKALYNDRELLKEMLLAGTENDENVRGRAEAIAQILRLDYEGFMEALAGDRYE